jgi:hypothetical protein
MVLLQRECGDDLGFKIAGKKDRKMKELRYCQLLLVVLMASGMIFSCRDDESESGPGGQDGRPGGDGNGSDDGNGEYETDFSNYEVCQHADVSPEARPVRVMILQDLSSSMNDNNKWGQAQNALTTLLNRYKTEIEFGFDSFPNKQTCYVGDPVKMDCAANGAEKIIEEVLPILDTMTSTPLYKALLNFLDPTYAPVFSGRDMERYLLLVSDGGDTCHLNNETVASATPAEVGAVAEQLLDDLDIKTLVIGFGLGTGQYEDGEALNAIAKAGGVLDEYIEVQDEAELTAALTNVGASVVGCVFDIIVENPEEVDLDLVNVMFDDTPVPRDDNCAGKQGWSWANDERDAIEFCQASCDKLKSGAVDTVTVDIMCSEGDVVVLVK